LAHLQVVDRRQDHRVVGGQRHLCEGLTGEGHQPDAICLAPHHKALDLLLGDLHPVLRLEVLGEHRAGDIDGERDIDALAGHALRPRP